jgi:hypothetical protein
MLLYMISLYLIVCRVGQESVCQRQLFYVKIPTPQKVVIGELTFGQRGRLSNASKSNKALLALQQSRMEENQM